MIGRSDNLLVEIASGSVTISSIRLKVWSVLLLGRMYSGVESSISEIDEECDEQHVLEADVKRTRADLNEFQSASYRSSVKTILQYFCVTHRIQYKQGMNEVLAPFIYLHPPPKGNLLPYELFEAFLFRYLQRYYCIDESYYLFKSFQLFNLLFIYYDPELAIYLQQNDFFPELYTPQWFLTLYARSLPLNYVLKLWDIILAIDDPAFIFFIGLSLLILHRFQLLTCHGDHIPELISILGLSFHGKEEEIDHIIQEALKMYKMTPRCFLRDLRLCCVSTLDRTNTSRNTHKTPNHTQQGSSNSRSSSNQYDIHMIKQSIRSCIMITAKELIDQMCPYIPHHSTTTTTTTTNTTTTQQDSNTSVINNAVNVQDLSSETATTNASNNIINQDQNSNDDGEENVTLSSPDLDSFFQSSSSSITTQLPYVILDLRSEDDIQAMGGCHFPKSIQMNPAILYEPDVLDAWLQHFDSMKNTCKLCIIDMPTTKLTATSLWRRLIFGEGDGNSSIITTATTTTSNLSSSSSTAAVSSKNQIGYMSSYTDTYDQLNPSLFRINQQSYTYTYMYDQLNPSLFRINQHNIHNDDSPYLSYEKDALDDDSRQSSIYLARILQSHHFPYVCVLEGGLPRLIYQLMHLRGTVEPLLINHNHEVFLEYIHNKGYIYDHPPPNPHYPLSTNDDDIPTTDNSDSKIPIKPVNLISQLMHNLKLSNPYDSFQSTNHTEYSHSHIYPYNATNIPSKYRKIEDLTSLEICQVALQKALHLQHDHIAYYLEQKLQNLMNMNDGND